MANHLIIRDDNDLEERYTPREMDCKIMEYFNRIVKMGIDHDLFISKGDEYREEYLEKHDGIYPSKPMKPTTSGLAMFLGFASRNDMNNVQPDGAYALIIRRGISMIEEFMEQELYSAHCGGAKFWLKNHGWVESQPKDFGKDKVVNVMIQAELVVEDEEKERQDLLITERRLKDAGLDIKQKVEVEIV